MCGGTKHKQSNKVTQNTQRAVVSGRNTKAGGWWLGLGTDCWVVRRKIVFLPPPLSKMLCMDGTVASHNSKQNNLRCRKGSTTVELDAVDHGLHHICLAGGTHERDTKGMGECSNTLQSHNNNFFFCCGGVIH